jgi:hypothetical protein
MTAVHAVFVAALIATAVVISFRRALHRVRSYDVHAQVTALRAATRVSRELFVARARMWNEAHSSDEP